MAWYRLARPYKAEAVPEDFHYFSDGLKASRNDMVPTMLYIDIEPNAEILILDATENECLVALSSYSPRSPKVSNAFREFANQRNLDLDLTTPGQMYFDIEMDSEFSATLQQLAIALAQYTSAQSWTYSWMGNRFGLPDHIEAESGFRFVSP